MIMLGILISLVAPGWALAHDSDDHPEDDFYHPQNWNGWRIYLSPAHHWDGPNYGCDAYVEDVTMRRLATHAAGVTTVGSGSLLDRGYRVRVGHGDPDDNIERSNRWPSDRHIALHSNAHGSAQCGATSGGTLAFYDAGRPHSVDLARKLSNKVGGDSPGGNDDAVAHGNLYELNQSNSPPAYLETEFHDWQKGKNWLVDYESWSWYLGYAVDVHLGYP